MTAPTQPPDPRVQRIAKAFDGVAMYVGKTAQLDLARVLVEELGGREEIPGIPADMQPAACIKRVNERIGEAVYAVLKEVVPYWPHSRAINTDIPTSAANEIRTLAEDRDACRAQQRENAETIQALKERAEKAERWQRQDQTTSDMFGKEITKLRAELDAIKGAQRSVTWRVHHNVHVVVTHDGTFYTLESNLADETFTSVDDIVREWPSASPHRAALEALRHPAPALPVVGACVVDGEEMTKAWSPMYGATQETCEREAIAYAKQYGGTAHVRLLGAPLPTEGGK